MQLQSKLVGDRRISGLYLALVIGQIDTVIIMTLSESLISHTHHLVSEVCDIKNVWPTFKLGYCYNKLAN